MSSSDFTRSSISLTYFGFGFRVGFLKKNLTDVCEGALVKQLNQQTVDKQEE